MDDEKIKDSKPNGRKHYTNSDIAHVDIVIIIIMTAIVYLPY
jgi:hypothetical protein